MREYIKKNRQVYNKLADIYLGRMQNRSKWESDPQKLAQFTFDFYTELYGRKPKKVLELGPGVGAMLKEFTNLGCATTAIEFSTKMAHIAYKNSPRTTFLIKDIITCSNLLYRQFDIIFASAFIHLFPLEDEKRVLNKIRKWASKDSIIYLNTTIHKNSCEGMFVKEDYGNNTEHFRRKWNKDEFLGFLSENDFEILDKSEKVELDRKKVWINVIIKDKKRKW